MRHEAELLMIVLAERMQPTPHQRWECGEMSASSPGRQGALQAQQASGCLCFACERTKSIWCVDTWPWQLHDSAL